MQSGKSQTELHISLSLQQRFQKLSSGGCLVNNSCYTVFITVSPATVVVELSLKKNLVQMGFF